MIRNDAGPTPFICIMIKVPTYMNDDGLICLLLGNFICRDNILICLYVIYHILLNKADEKASSKEGVEEEEYLFLTVKVPNLHKTCQKCDLFN